MDKASLINFTLIDFGILIIILISVIIGLFRGFIKEALSIVVWILSVYIALKFYQDLSGYFTFVSDNGTIRSAIAIGVLFLGSLISGSVISHLISLLVKSTGLSGTDKFLGIIFGFFRGALIAAVIILIVSYTEFSKNPMWQNSFLIKQMHPITDWMNGFIPDTVKQKVKGEHKKTS